MTKTIQAAFEPLLIIGSLCGLTFFEYPLGRSRPYLTCLYFLITWSIFAYLFYYFIYDKSINNISSIYMFWPNKIIMLSAIISIPINLFRFKEINMCLHKLSIVDDTLEMLGTPKEYRRLHNWTIRIIIGWIVLTFLTNISDSFWLSYDYFIICILISFVGNHLLHVNICNSLICGTILKYISSRFQQINEHIHNLTEDDIERSKRQNELISLNQRRMERKKCRQYMWIIMHVHLQLCLVSRELNKIFSMQMTLQMATYFACLVETFVTYYMLYIDKNPHANTTNVQILDNLCVYFWIVIFSAKILALNYICQTVCNKANETIAILHKLSNDSPVNLREQTLQFILQIKQRELKLSGMGLFYFGYSFIRQFCTSITTVLIIIIQMPAAFIEYN